MCRTMIIRTRETVLFIYLARVDDSSPTALSLWCLPLTTIISERTLPLSLFDCPSRATNSQQEVDLISGKCLLPAALRSWLLNISLYLSLGVHLHVTYIIFR